MTDLEFTVVSKPTCAAGDLGTGDNRCNAQIAPDATWTATMVFDIETGDTPRSLVFTEDYQGNATVPL